VLVLDELGSEAQGRDVVRELVHERHASGRATIVTTWLGSADENDRKEACMAAVREMYGDGTARRLFERGLLIEIGGA
jgi:DNA replication protein DnaC